MMIQTCIVMSCFWYLKLCVFKPIIPDNIFPSINGLENKDKLYTLNDYSWSTYNISEQTENNIDS